MSSAWYGNVPEEWESVSLRYLTESTTGGTPDRSNSEFWEGDIPWVSPKDMTGSEVDDAEEYVTKEAVERSSMAIVPEGSLLVVARSGILKHSIPVAVAASPVAINQDIRGYTLRDDNVDPKYLQLFVTSHQKALLNLWKKQGATVQSLDSDAMAETKFPIPPVREQQAIADFLDRRTAHIDALVAKQKRLVGLLNEKRQASITQAVTAGLDTTVAMESTEMEWLNEIPEHWDTTRTRFVARLESGHTPSKSNDEYWTDTDVPWVSLADSGRLRENDRITETEHYTNQKGLNNSSAHLLPVGTVVFTRDATVGLCAILDRPMAVAQHLVGWVCGPKILPEYLLNVFKSMDREFDLLTRGSTISTIGMPDIRSLETPLPPVEEQREIVEHIESETERISTLVDNIEQSINLLEEKRQALITAAVTGQIDVTEEREEPIDAPT